MSTQNPDYQQLWDTMVIRKEKLEAVKKAAKQIAANFEQYLAVSQAAAAAIPNGSLCPWYVIGVIHYMECFLSFTKHLHNGDPLTARTTHVPAGRPKKGEPPFTWHDSAVDAIRLIDFNNAAYDWSNIVFVLERLEAYNGVGYKDGKGIYSPYLWSFTNQYFAGKYTSDGKYDPKAISQQVGCAPILSLLLAQP